jgi:hypothetical protein
MRRVRAGLFGIGVAVALGFGSAQAVAAPANAAAAGEARACNPTGCDNSCRAKGGISGRCTDSGLCACFF